MIFEHIARDTRILGRGLLGHRNIEHAVDAVGRERLMTRAGISPFISKSNHVIEFVGVDKAYRRELVGLSVMIKGLLLGGVVVEVTKPNLAFFAHSLLNQVDVEQGIRVLHLHARRHVDTLVHQFAFAQAGEALQLADEVVGQLIGQKRRTLHGVNKHDELLQVERA